MGNALCSADRADTNSALFAGAMPTCWEESGQLLRTPFLGSVTLHFAGEPGFCQMESREKSNLRMAEHPGVERFRFGNAALQRIFHPFLNLASSSTRRPSPACPTPNPFAGAIHVIPILDCHSVLPCLHSLVAFQRQRFGLGVFLLSSQAGAQQAFGPNPCQSSGCFLRSNSMASRARGSLSVNLP